MTNISFYGITTALPRLIASGAMAFLFGSTSPLLAETFTNAGGTLLWNDPANWTPMTVPNAVGATAIFLDPSGNTNVGLDGTAPGGITVGSIAFTNDSGSSTITIQNGVGGGPLIFDAVDAGPATITTNGFSSGNNTIVATMVFTDTVLATVNQLGVTSQAGSLNLTGAISGPGGFIKAGDGVATFGSGLKTYEGATVLNAGRMRISATAAPSASSSFTINSGAQLELITNGTYNLGSGLLFLNGSGIAQDLPNGQFPGAIRTSSNNRQAVITNATVLQSDTTIHVEGTAALVTFTNSISGPGKLILGARNAGGTQGTLTLNGNNTYQGGTLVRGGTLIVSGASATLGTGNVVVDNTGTDDLGVPYLLDARAILTIETGVLNAINDTATLSLKGGLTPNLADQGYANLGLGVNELVGGLFLGGVAQTFGTYGSSASGAQFQFDEYFAGNGIITVVPEPSAVALGMVGGLMALLRRRKR